MNFSLSGPEREVIDLIPTHYIRWIWRTLDTRALLTINPDCHIKGETIWVKDPLSSIVSSHRLDITSHHWLEICKLEGPSSAKLPQDALFMLLLAGILFDPHYVNIELNSRYLALKGGCENFRRYGYASIPHVLPALLLGTLRRHYRYLVHSGAMRLGDGQSPLRYVMHNEAVASFIHQQLTQIVSTLSGTRVKPSYVYTACYQPGARLPRHTDREQCEYSISICVDYVPEPAGPTPWPLWLETATGAKPIYQALGDALFYRGRLLPHYRQPLPADNYSTSIFLHYVADSFVGPLK